MAKTTSAVSLISTRKRFHQILASFSVMGLLIELGISSGWSSPYITKLESTDSPLTITDNQASWIASLMNLGRFAGSIFGAVSTHHFGCKTTLLIALFPMSGCWLCTVFVVNLTWIYVSRVLGGIAMGMLNMSFPLYLGEISLPEIRGALISIGIVGNSLGILLGNVIGSYLPMNVTGIACFIPCCALIAIFFCLPESPHHLVKCEKIEEAKASIGWYRGNCEIDEELISVSNFVRLANSESFWTKLQQLFSEPYLFRAFMLSSVLFIYMQICGFNIILFYLETLLSQAKVTVVETATAANLISVSALFGSMLSIFFIDKVGRRSLLFVSSVGVTLSMLGLGTHFQIVEQGRTEIVESYQWLPIISMVLFNFTFYFGLMTVPNTVASEVFPANVKCIAACITGLVTAFFAFIAAKSYQPLLDVVSRSTVFYMNAGIASTLVPYVWVFVPETKGKTLQEIQHLLSKC